MRADIWGHWAAAAAVWAYLYTTEPSRGPYLGLKVAIVVIIGSVVGQGLIHYNALFREELMRAEMTRITGIHRGIDDMLDRARFSETGTAEYRGPRDPSAPSSCRVFRARGTRGTGGAGDQRDPEPYPLLPATCEED